MAKKAKKNQQFWSQWPQFDLDPETQRGIISILLLATALIIAFSLFGLAGDVGVVIDNILRALIGMGRYTIPVIFFIMVYNLLYPKEDGEGLDMYYLFGIVLLATSLIGCLDIFQAGSGGYIGMALTYLFRQFASVIVAIVVFIALFIISILIVFNTSLNRIAEFLPASSLIGKIFRFVIALFSQAKHHIGLAREQALAHVEDSYDQDNTTKDNSEEDLTDISETGGFSKKTLKRTRREKASKADDEVSEQKELIQLSSHHRKIDVPVNLLSAIKGKPTSGDIRAHQAIIKRTLESFNVAVEMDEVNIGPTVTQYTFKPLEGVKVSQIVSLQNDVALALAAHPIRIEAPIPGKSLVGIEVPNMAAARVGLRELLESKIFTHRKTNLTLLLGRDVSGEPFSAELGAMPHALIAGATGSGKSVCLNTILLSLLYQNGPDDLKLILVDPKRVELTMFDGIPHLLTPVITDVQKTINALKWTVNEMDRRYEILSHAKNKDITTYNTEHPDATMPYIVFVIDELADLMATAPREVEAAIVRLAQMARAVGIHLILATQRPSVDVITGLIKANITARCAFSTASLIDSRTILDMSGAEKLLGKGDMLYTSAEFSKPKRIQGAYIGEDEIKRVVTYLKSQAAANYDDEVVTPQAVTSMPQAFNDGESEDDLLPQAKEVIMQSQKASASLLQRRLRIGYARAARILDILEDQGFIGPADGAKPREILFDADEYTVNEEQPGTTAEDIDEEQEDIEEKEVDSNKHDAV